MRVGAPERIAAHYSGTPRYPGVFGAPSMWANLCVAINGRNVYIDHKWIDYGLSSVGIMPVHDNDWYAES